MIHLIPMMLGYGCSWAVTTSLEDSAVDRPTSNYLFPSPLYLHKTNSTVETFIFLSTTAAAVKPLNNILCKSKSKIYLIRKKIKV